MFKNIVWDFFGKFSVQLISFGITVLLTRMISPEEFGIMGMALAVIFIAHLFLDLGFNRALIQQPEVSQLEFSTVFYLNILIAISMGLICYFASGPLSSFYHQPIIKPIFKVLSLTFLINGLNLVPSAILYKELKFKINSILNIISSVVGGLIGVVLAYRGFGVWSLVTQSISTSVIILITNFAYAKWLPQLSFSLSSIKPMWRYGSRMFASGLLDAVFTKLDIFIIGKIFPAAILGYYTRAQSMDNLVRQLSVNSIMSALFPYISKHQHDRVFLREMFTRYLHIIAFTSIAMSGTLFLISSDLFAILFTRKWQFAAELFQLLSIVGFAWPISSLMCNIIAGVGNSKTFLRLEMYKKILFLPVYAFGFLLGLKGFLWIYIVANVLGMTLNAFYLFKELGISVIKQLKPVLSYFLIGCLSAIATYLLNSLFEIENSFIKILELVALFNALYLMINYIFKLTAFQEIQFQLTKLHKAFYDKCNKNISATL